MLTFRFFAATIIGASVALGVSAKSGSCQSLPPLDSYEVDAIVSTDTTATLVSASGTQTYGGVTVTAAVGSMSTASVVGACFGIDYYSATESPYGAEAGGTNSPGSSCTTETTWVIGNNSFSTYYGTCEFGVGIYASVYSNWGGPSACSALISDGTVTATCACVSEESADQSQTSLLIAGTLPPGASISATINGMLYSEWDY